MDGASYGTRRPQSCPPSYITRSTRSSSESRPQRSSHGRLPLSEIGEQTPQAANEAVSFPQRSICEKPNLSSDSVDSTTPTIVPPNQTTHSRQARLRSLLWRILLIVLPIALLAALLLGLVFGLKVKTEPSLFPINDGSAATGQDAYILVNLSATKLGLVPNLMSLVAPC